MPIIIRIVLIALYTMLMLSCSFNAGYSPKQSIKIPKVWHTKNQQFIAKDTNMSSYAWWKKFKDPVLNKLIDTGLEQNNDINVAVANIEAARGELKRIKLNWLPNVGSLLGYSSFPYLGYPGVIAAAFPSYTINILTQIEEQKKAKHELKITKNIRDTVRQTVITQITGNYLSYIAQVERLNLLQQVEDDIGKNIDIYRAAYQGGLYSDIKLAKIQSFYDLVKSEEMIIRKNIIIHQNAIQYLLNKNPDSLGLTKPFSEINNENLVIGALPFNTLENRPDMVQATNELFAANENTNIAVSHFLPTVQLIMGRGDIATIPNGKTLGHPIYFNQSVLQTPLVTLSTFGEWEKTKGLSKASYYRYENTLRRVLREVDDDLATNEYFTTRLQKTLHAEQKFAESYQLNSQLYKQGIISYSQLLKEKMRLDRIKIKVNQHKLDKIMSVIHLYQDLAVGYAYANPATPVKVAVNKGKVPLISKQEASQKA